MVTTFSISSQVKDFLIHENNFTEHCKVMVSNSLCVWRVLGLNLILETGHSEWGRLYIFSSSTQRLKGHAVV
jgi:hypothetical protein